MADAPEVVPESMLKEQQQQHVAHHEDDKKQGLSPSSPDDGQTEKELSSAENEDMSPKHLVPDEGDKAGSGIEALGREEKAIDPSKPQPALSGEHGTQVRNANSAHEEREWHSGFWNWTADGSLCAESITCPCVLAGRTHTRLHNPTTAHLPSTNLYCAGCCFLGLTIIAAVPLCCFMTVAQRREIRYKYDINGSNADDCWKATFCVPCAIAQEERELLWRAEQAKRNEEQGGMAKREDKMKYQRT